MLKRLPKKKSDKRHGLTVDNIKKQKPRTFKRDKRNSRDDKDEIIKQQAVTLSKKNARDSLKNENIKKVESKKYGYNPLFYVTPKKKIEGLSRKVAYPVFSMDIQYVNLGDCLVEKDCSVKGGTGNNILESMLDKDDEEVIEDKLDNKEEEESVVVWFFIANVKTGNFQWVDSSVVRFLP